MLINALNGCAGVTLVASLVDLGHRPAQDILGHGMVIATAALLVTVFVVDRLKDLARSRRVPCQQRIASNKNRR